MNINNKKLLDLGCGPDIRNYYNADEVFGVDIVDFNNKKIKVADLVIEPIPFEDNSFDYVTGFDFIEHIPRLIYYKDKRKQPFIDLMNEIYRVLKPNGIFRAETPAVPSYEAFADPTHINYIAEWTHLYFCGREDINNIHYEWGKIYGFNGQFVPKIVEWHKEHKTHLIWELEAIK
jgi:SAM-dependent methyltransferase